MIFGLRTKRTLRDRQHGLVFRWRLPVGSNLGFLSACGVVALIVAGLATTVRVRVGNASRHPDRRGSLILVPQGAEWQSLTMMALEAGPMPRREDPAENLVLASIIDRAMADALPPGYQYQPKFRSVEVEMPAVVSSSVTEMPLRVLPPLPRLQPPSQNPPLPDPSRPIILADGDVTTMSPDSLPPAELARGNRYLLHYDSSGRVIRATTIYASGPDEDHQGEQWLRQVRISGGDAGGGWLAVEISSGS